MKALKIVYKYLVFCRRAFFTYLTKKLSGSYGKHLTVNAFSVITSKTFLGTNVNFNGIKIRGQGNVVIGDNFHSGQDCLIISQIHNYEGTAIPYDSTYILKDVTIEDNVWIGDRVIILGGVTIGEGAIVQAGSVVVKSIPKCSIAGGHPAIVFSKRDEKHYYELKSRSKFH